VQASRAGARRCDRSARLPIEVRGRTAAGTSTWPAAMKTYSVSSPGELAKLLQQHMRQRAERLRAATVPAAEVGAMAVRRGVPAPHGELADAVKPERRPAGAAIVVDAPFAAAVETGSRPHTPPLEPLIAWVKLRGAQGLLPSGRGRRSAAAAAHSARSVAGALAAMERGGALDVGAPVAIARAIQHAIATRGTRPHWFVRGALPAVRAAVGAAIKEALQRGP
jgi:hypothetical protein